MFSDNDNLKKTTGLPDKVYTGVIYVPYIVPDFAPLITNIKYSAVFADTIYEKRNP